MINGRYCRKLSNLICLMNQCVLVNTFESVIHYNSTNPKVDSTTNLSWSGCSYEWTNCIRIRSQLLGTDIIIVNQNQSRNGLFDPHPKHAVQCAPVVAQYISTTSFSLLIIRIHTRVHSRILMIRSHKQALVDILSLDRAYLWMWDDIWGLAG